MKNISFSGFNWNGLTLEYADATNNTIAGCWLGLDATGTNAAPNAFQGILFAEGASHNIIGGTNALARNVISGNAQYGIWMSDSNTTGNTVLGNYIGTDASGSVAVPNPGGGIGMFYNSAGHVIGGTNASARNVISGNGNAGIWLAGSGVSNNLVEGNLHRPERRRHGRSAEHVRRHLCGERRERQRHSQQRHFRKLRRRAAPLPTRARPATSFREISSVPINRRQRRAERVPWPQPLQRRGRQHHRRHNRCRAQSHFRQCFRGFSHPRHRRDRQSGPGKLHRHRYWRNQSTGENGWTGMTIFSGATSNMIGGTVAGARNVISGNSAYGVVAADAGISGNLIQGNYIGPGMDGMSAVPNNDGILFSGGATNNLLGGTSAGAANFVSGNAYRGISISDPGTSGNFIRGNFIGTDHTGTNAFGNFDNVELQAGATGYGIGGVGAGAGNVIAFANGTGVILYDAATTNNSIRGNAIFNNHYLGIDLNGDGVTANHTGFLIGPNDFQNFPVITNAFGSGAGTIVEGTLNSVVAKATLLMFIAASARTTLSMAKARFTSAA